jgi:hypothetical protein
VRGCSSSKAGLDAYIGDTRYDGALELSLVQFLHGGLQVIGGFKFHKPWLNVNALDGSLAEYSLPTLCPVLGQFQSTPRPVQTGGRSLSSPIQCMVSPGPGKVRCPANVERKGKHSMSSPRRGIQMAISYRHPKVPGKVPWGMIKKVW